MGVNTKIAKTTKNVGRPLGVVHDRPFQMRVNEQFLTIVDEWRKAQPGILPSRTEAIRRLVELGARRTKGKST